MTASTDYGTKFCLGVKRVFRSKRRIKYFVRKKTIQMPTCSAGFSFAQGVYFIFAVPCVFARENDSPMFFTQTQHFLFFFAATTFFHLDPVFSTRSRVFYQTSVFLQTRVFHPPGPPAMRFLSSPLNYRSSRKNSYSSAISASAEIIHKLWLQT